MKVLQNINITFNGLFETNKEFVALFKIFTKYSIQFATIKTRVPNGSPKNLIKPIFYCALNIMTL